MDERGFDGAERPEFWLSHVRAGVLLSELACVLVLLYLVVEPGPDHEATVAVLAVVAMAGTGALLLLPLRRIVAHPRAAAFFYAWSLIAAAITTAGCAVTGGSKSPLVSLYFLMLVYAATAYPPAAILHIAVGIIGAYAAMVAQQPESVGISVVVAGTLALTAWMCSIAARNQWHQLQEQTELARVDGLTGCLNHRSFRETIDAEVERARRFDHPLALVLVDLDRFKSLNDSRGHLEGDALLRTVGARLRESVRRIDAVGRIGGDEFALLLIETGRHRALEVAERVRRRCQLSTGPHSTTVSVGVAQLTTDGSSTSLLRDADEALYEAKRAGRDAVRFSDDARPHQGATAGG